MELAFWTYEGPTHMGALRVATAMRGVHCLLHAPQGDGYADLLFTMIERRPARPPVSYTSFQQRDLGRGTADLIKDAARAAYERFRPEVLLVGESCTAELLQDQAGALVRSLGLPVPVLPLDLPSWSRKETWGASETFHRLVRALLKPRAPAPGTPRPNRAPGQCPRANLLGPIALGFRCRDDITAVSRLLAAIGVKVQVTAPLGARPADLLRLPEADFNICLYPEIAESTCVWLERTFRQPWVRTVPIGVGATRDFLAEVGRVAEDEAVAEAAARLAARVDVYAVPAASTARSLEGEGLEAGLYLPRLPWYSHSVDATYLTGKRVFIFGDATHAIAAARIVDQELGMTLVGLGTYLREQARPVREAARHHGLEALISDDYLEVEVRIAEAHPELVLGTQMERHIAKRLGIPCAVISAPAHVQDFPARYAPQMGFEGADVIFDAWIGPLMMGLEEHLLSMFRGDFEFGEVSPAVAEGPPAGNAAASLAASLPEMALPGVAGHSATIRPEAVGEPLNEPVWDPQAENELKKIPFFVRGKARRNTERFARERGLATITLETLYDAKAHFGR
ncbi:MAG: ferredoxin:protochlorophyllide reductase (ATP-dependent) subunit B [Gammaproteobacteria bacterium]|nr:MAG: ferredoxin:protochlorophyllide reductase (ATP-dependent) subunit B [Gammaproteobacteria bacterium]